MQGRGRVRAALACGARSLFAAGVLIAPGIAHAVGARLGDPGMLIETAQMAPPYHSTFDLHATAGSGLWPALSFRDQRDDTQRDAGGRIAITSVYNTNTTFKNQALVWADDTGMFGGESRMEDVSGLASYVGTFTHVRWAQGFRKDDTDAHLNLIFTGAELYVRGLAAESRAEFTFEATAFHSTGTFFTGREAAGLRITYGSPPPVNQTIETSMPWTQSNPDGFQRDSKIVFSGTTVPVDLSSVPVGTEFTLYCDLVTEASFPGGEVPGCHATVGDAGSMTGGVQLEAAGLTPTDDPLDPPVTAVGPALDGSSVALSPARPNPSEGTVAMDLELPAAGDVSVDVYDMSGRRVASLAHGAMSAGRHTLRWDGRDARGAELPAGVYYARAAGAGVRASRRVVRLAGGR